MLSRVTLVRTDVYEELSASFIRVTRTTRRNIPEDAILHCHRRENLKSYTEKAMFGVGSPQLHRLKTIPSC
jgi:hypothetical protein